MKPEYIYYARVNRWVDGDTVDLTIDLGFHIFLNKKCRLVEINTPERGKPLFFEALERAMELAPPGVDTVIQSFKDPEDKYGRILVRIQGQDGRIINAVLLMEGLAVRYQ